MTSHPTPFVETFGAGLANSLNYERVVFDRFALRTGVGMWGGRAQYSDNSSIERGFIAIPITVSYLGVRAGPHVLELGGGITIDNGGGGPRLLTVYASAEPFRVDRVRGEPMVCFISARGGRATEDHEGQGRRYTGSKALG